MKDTSKSYQDHLSILGIDTLQQRRSIFDLIEVFKIVHNLSPLQFSDFSAFDTNKITRGHQYKLSKQRFQLNIRKYSFSVRVVNMWNCLPSSSHIVCASSVLQSFD